MITSLHLAGPFLVNDSAFAHLFESLGRQLIHVHLEHAAKLGSHGIQSLTAHCAKLKSLALANCRLVGSEVVESLVTLTSLETLILEALGDAVKGVSDEALVKVLKSVGGRLRILRLEK